MRSRIRVRHWLVSDPRSSWCVMRSLLLTFCVMTSLFLPVVAQQGGTSPSAQNDDELTARRLFYREPRDEEKPAPVPAAATAAKQTAQEKPAGQPPSAHTTERPDRRRNAGESGSRNGGAAQVVRVKNTPAQTAKLQPVSNLGLRYNVMLVDIKTGQRERVDSARKFRKGECVAFEFESNRSGYLYVLSHGSSGKWDALLPSPQMPDEANVIRSRSPLVVPANYCFEILDPPGVDRFFVIVARDANEVYPLHDSIRKQQEAAEPSTAATMMAANRLGDEVALFEGQLRSRDVRVVKIVQPRQTGEAAHSVYVANAGAERPTNLMTEIRIDHQ